MNLNHQDRMNTKLELETIIQGPNCLSNLERWSLVTFAREAMLKTSKSHNEIRL